MKSYNYIKAKQTAWARRRGLTLTDSTNDGRGEKNYVKETNQNIFQGLSEKTNEQFEKGQGNELKNKMRALHSSSAIAVNIFQYWKNEDEVRVIAKACGFCYPHNQDDFSLEFERKFEITPKSVPHLDVVIENTTKNKILAIESKLTEPFSHRGLKGIEKYYIDKDLWQGLSSLYGLAKKLCPDNKCFEYLDVAQLIKHILGLKKQKQKFRLLYLWYDVAGEESEKHRKEISEFAEIAKSDKIDFRFMSYQELISKLSEKLYVGNEEYINYITDRYL